MNRKDLTIIVVSYNTREIIKGCLQSVIDNSKGINREIIVVDNASTDGSADLLRKEFPGIKLIANRTNVGFSKANNQGIKIANGENILLLNSDTVILNNCLHETLKFVNSKPDAGVVGCKVLFTNGRIQYSCSHKPSVLTETIFFTKEILKSFWDPITFWRHMGYLGHRKVKKVDCISGCFFWVKRNVFDRIGLLDENIFMFYEDFEFCIRMQSRTDYKAYYFPFAEIIHSRGASYSADNYSNLTIQNSYKSARYYFRKCYSKKCAGIFNNVCNFIWKIELFLFRPLNIFEKCKKKIDILKELRKL